MRLRLILSFIFIVLTTIALMVGVTLAGTRREVNAFMLYGGLTGVDELAARLEDYYTDNGSWQGVEILLAGPGMMHGNGPSGMMGGMMDQRFRLADAQGIVLVDTDGTPRGVLSSIELQNAVELFSRGERVGYLAAEGGFQAGPGTQQNLIARLNRAAVTAALIATGLSLVLAFLLAYGLLRPVHALTRAARMLAEGNLSHRVNVRGDDEISSLGSAFNAMANSLQKADETRKVMTADIAHELRNPLAVQRAHLEALQDGIYPLTPENLAPVLEQNQTLTRLVDDLRTLALADSGELAIELRPADVAELVRRTVERFTPQAESKGVKLDLEITDDIPVLSLDATRVEQILGNLMANALRYTPEAGKIVIRLERNGDTTRISIHDSDPGISEEALERLFERFYRADKSRSRSEGGTGLGLAIARKLAEAHGGSVRAENHPQGGAVFTLDLPVRAYGSHK